MECFDDKREALGSNSVQRLPSLFGDIERFIAMVSPQPNGCWLWTGNKDRKGYAKFWYAKAVRRGARFAYETFRGPFAAGQEPDHLCRTPSCVNPDHLEAVSRQENVRRGDSPVGLNARKTHCKWGHPFDKQNTYVPAKRPGQRYCRQCLSNNALARYWRNKYAT